MEIQCECGHFRGEVLKFPRETPGRMGCYCDDCQSYLIYLKRTDLLDSAGCTEIVPVYPQNLILDAQSKLKCIRLSERGMYRWVTTCCNTPVANTLRGLPWIGLFAGVFTAQDPAYLEKTLGKIKVRILGMYAKGKPAPGTAKKMNLRAVIAVLPFILKGKILGKGQGSPFFEKDGRTPILPPTVLTLEERRAIREEFERQEDYL